MPENNPVVPLSEEDTQELAYFKKIINTAEKAAMVTPEYALTQAKFYMLCRMDEFGMTALNEFNFRSEAGAKAALDHRKKLIN